MDQKEREACSSPRETFPIRLMNIGTAALAPIRQNAISRPKNDVTVRSFWATRYAAIRDISRDGDGLDSTERDHALGNAEDNSSQESEKFSDDSLCNNQNEEGMMAERVVRSVNITFPDSEMSGNVDSDRFCKEHRLNLTKCDPGGKTTNSPARESKPCR